MLGNDPTAGIVLHGIVILDQVAGLIGEVTAGDEAEVDVTVTEDTVGAVEGTAGHGHIALCQGGAGRAVERHIAVDSAAVDLHNGGGRAVTVTVNIHCQVVGLIQAGQGTTIDVQAQLLLGVHIGAGKLRPDRAGTTQNLTAVDGNGVLISSAVGELTDRHIVVTHDLAAVDHQDRVADGGVVVDSVTHMRHGLGGHLNGTAVDGQLAAVDDGVVALTEGSVCRTGIGADDLAITLDSQIALVGDHAFALGGGGVADGLAVQVQSDLGAGRNGQCLFQSDVLQDHDGVSLLGSRDGLTQSGIGLFADLCCIPTDFRVDGHFFCLCGDDHNCAKQHYNHRQ